MINSVLIVIFGKLYREISQRLVKFENHRYAQSVENSLINKIYMFEFVNTYISNFVYIFFYQNFFQLQKNMIIVMVLKQILMNSGKYLWLVCKTGKKINNMSNIFDRQLKKAKGLKRADLEMHMNIEKEQHMEKAQTTLVFQYNEAVIQMGFMAFFAVSFPLAPLFSFFTNLLDIRIKL